MAELLKGKEVAAGIIERTSGEVLALKEKSIIPTLAVFRVGQKDEDLSYERGIDKRSAEAGIEVRRFVFEEDVDEETFFSELDKANEDKDIHGILIFRPLPKRFDDVKVRNHIKASKDVDGCSDMSLAGVFTDTELGFAPCTAKAVIEILDHYGIEISGKKVTVLGRSLVIGKPVAMLLLNRNATVTICHTKTKDIQKIAADADILITATGVMESIGKEYLSKGQTIIDVGISWNEEKKKLCGDVLFEEAEPLVSKITPVPGGVGSVTTSVLVNNVVEAAKRSHE